MSLFSISRARFFGYLYIQIFCFFSVLWQKSCIVAKKSRKKVYWISTWLKETNKKISGEKRNTIEPPSGDFHIWIWSGCEETRNIFAGLRQNSQQHNKTCQKHDPFFQLSQMKNVECPIKKVSKHKIRLFMVYELAFAIMREGIKCAFVGTRGELV